MKRMFLILGSITLVLIGAGSLSAGQPSMYTDSGSGIGLIGDCGDFEVWQDVAWAISGKFYFDKTGLLIVKIKERWRVEGFVYNASHPENYLPYKNSRYVVTELIDELGNIETHITGLWAMIVVPGYGPIFMDVGHIAWDPLGNVIFDAGKHQWWDANVDELCDFLANGD